MGGGEAILTAASAPAISNASDIAALIRQLRDANVELRRRSTDDILSVLDRVVAAWLAPHSPWRQTAEELLPAATGFSAQMIRDGLPTLLEPLRASEVYTLLQHELGSAPHQGPGIIAHIMSGNIPGLSASSIVLSLAIGSCAMVKAAHDDRVFPQLFAESISAADPALGACVAAAYWPGGNTAIEDEVCRSADIVVAFGSDTSIASLRERCRTRFIGYGHRISFAVMTQEIIHDASALATTAAALADDISLWDQRGCLSPQLCFVEGDFTAACDLAGALAPALDATGQRWPPGIADVGQLTAIRRFRDEAEWRALKGEPVRLLAPTRGLGWSIIVDADPVFQPTALGRSFRIFPITSLDSIEHIVAPARPLLEAAGIAAPDERRDEVRAVLARAGVHWTPNVGSMQQPPLTWCPGARPRIADWVLPQIAN